MQTIKDRLAEFLDSLNIGQAKFAQLCGLSKGFANNVGDSIRVVSMKKILAVYPELNQNWLLTGEGEMLKTQSDNPTINYAGKGVPYYNVDFIGGFDVVLNDQTANPECYIDFPAYERTDMWANITGKSMEPLISHGDMIALRKVEDWDTYMLYGEIYGIVTDEYRTVKKVRTSKKGDDFIRLVPMNEQFDEQDIPKSIVRAVFQIIGCAKKIF